MQSQTELKTDPTCPSSTSDTPDIPISELDTKPTYPTVSESGTPSESSQDTGTLFEIDSDQEGSQTDSSSNIMF